MERARDWEHLDFTKLDKIYPAKTGIYSASEEAILERARAVRKWLYHRSERYVIVMTHSGFLRRVAPSMDKYKNAEYRLYQFAQEDQSDEDRPYHLLQIDQVHQSLQTDGPDAEQAAV